MKQTRRPEKIVVVDSSPENHTKNVVARYPDVVYLRNDAGVGTTATSRAIAVEHTTCDVIAFLDDDSVPLPDWLAAMLRAYEDPGVVAVGGRVVNSAEEAASADPTNIGKFLPNGRLTGNFAADPGYVVEVAHLLGANMSYRRTSISQVGGIREFYPGTCAREDTDLGLRMWQSGMRVVFNPAATVNHISGGYAKGRRFDRRYQYFTHRNHMVLLSTVFGVSSPYLRRYAGSVLREQGPLLKARLASATSWSEACRTLIAGLTRTAADFTGLAAGVGAGLLARRGHRREAAGEAG
jgi:GT2 family glycosyltransferase